MPPPDEPLPTLAVLPVKSFSAAKGRLAAQLGPTARAALAEAMLGDVLEALGRAEELDRVAVVTAEPRATAIASGFRAQVVHDPHEAGQSPAASLGIEHAARERCARALLVPGDTPLLEPGHVDGLLRRSASAGLAATIVPDRHGTGTNALLLTLPAPIAPSFGPGSLERHVAAARAAGATYAVEPLDALEHDVDTPEDLDALVARLREAPARTGARTRATAAVRVPTGA